MNIKSSQRNFVTHQRQLQRAVREQEQLAQESQPQPPSQVDSYHPSQMRYFATPVLSMFAGVGVGLFHGSVALGAAAAVGGGALGFALDRCFENLVRS